MEFEVEVLTQLSENAQLSVLCPSSLAKQYEANLYYN